MNKEWNKIIEESLRVDNMSCVPNPYEFKRYQKGYVFDENKSVKWNRESVEKANDDYDKEVARLNTEKNKARDKNYKEIYALIQSKISKKIDSKKAELIWKHVFNSYRGEKIEVKIRELEEIIKLFNDVM